MYKEWRSGTCNKVCVGIKAEEACNTTSQCDPNLYCANGKCTKLLQKGQACQSEYDCATDLGCYEGKCTPYFSIKVGEVMESLHSELFCETLYLHKDNDGKVYCASYETESYKITDEQNSCQYTVKFGKDKTENTTRSCSCNAEKLGLFCPMGTTHSEYKDEINSLSKYFKKEASKHNVKAKLRYFSFDATKALAKFEMSPFFDGFLNVSLMHYFQWRISYLCFPILNTYYLKTSWYKESNIYNFNFIL